MTIRYCCVWNLCGYPSIAVGNVGLGEGEYEGLPIAVQVIASPHREDIVFAVSKYLQLAV
jgi:Asp-tRNA(Asn)/Glu-tRNA(Gln) amidotransferase A subunit family amidase